MTPKYDILKGLIADLMAKAGPLDKAIYERWKVRRQGQIDKDLVEFLKSPETVKFFEDYSEYLASLVQSTDEPALLSIDCVETLFTQTHRFRTYSSTD